MASSNPFKNRNEEQKERKASFYLWMSLALVACAGLMLWNESNYVSKKKKIGEAVELQIGKTIDPSMEGKVVFVSHPVTSSRVYQEKFLQSHIDAIKVDRSVQFYQTVENVIETKKKTASGQDTTVYSYEYHDIWTDTPQTKAFKGKRNQNTVRRVLADSSFTDAKASVGPYRFDVSMLKRARSVPLTLTQDNSRMRFSNVHFKDDEVYLGSDPNHPAVGDVIISYTGIPSGELSFVALVKDGAFVDARIGPDTPIRIGSVPYEQMVGKIKKEQGFNARMICIMLSILSLVLVFLLFKERNFLKFLLAFWITSVVICTLLAIPWMFSPTSTWMILLLPLAVSVLGYLVAYLIHRIKPKKKKVLFVDADSAEAYGLGPEFKGWLN